MKKNAKVWISVLMFVTLIVGCLFVDLLRTQKYITLEREVKSLEKTQYEKIEYNKRLISEISMRTTPERIEKIARDELGMRMARPEEVVRIKIEEGGAIYD